MDQSDSLTTIATEHDFSDFLAGLPDEPQPLRDYAVILKPDHCIGTVEGHKIDAAQNLAYILSEVLRFKVLLIDIHKIDIKTLGMLAAENLNHCKSVLDPVDSLATFLRMCGVVFGEGGRQSVYEPSSFNDSCFSQDQFIQLLRALGSKRAAVNTAPGIYICLSHQGMAEALLETLKAVIHAEDRDQCIKPRWGFRLQDQFNNTVSVIKKCGEALTVKDDYDKCLAQSIYDKKIMVHKNEQPEKKQTFIRPYIPSAHVFELPPIIYKVYEETAKKYSGLVEDVIRLKDMKISMIHNDEVEECTILYLNWALHQLWLVSRKIARKVNQEPGLLLAPTVKTLLHLPLGIEITSSTYYTEMRDISSTGIALTDVASTAVYYYEYTTGLIKRDFTFQFHPEVGNPLRMISRKDIQTMHIPELEDGIKLLIAAVYTGNMAAGCYPL